ncbi:hypothetical protein K435DRAFT_969079 [Dendrothele bispora CBS 962.96]|uniref:Uncharacterized protein n=1 Tax=Dendrothele bispora (strain CBS 962.96) TaxID=1314807 RepID=A0A4V4HE42_DENBC|nr:hypothetical protein K435DRAFT_969079 [Dendrothele bispora CBS 962.96]
MTEASSSTTVILHGAWPLGDPFNSNGNSNSRTIIPIGTASDGSETTYLDEVVIYGSSSTASASSSSSTQASPTTTSSATTSFVGEGSLVPVSTWQGASVVVSFTVLSRSLHATLIEGASGYAVQLSTNSNGAGGGGATMLSCDLNFNSESHPQCIQSGYSVVTRTKASIPTITSTSFSTQTISGSNADFATSGIYTLVLPVETMTTTTTETGSGTGSSSSGHRASILGPAIGGAIGGSLLLALVCLLLFLYQRRRRSRATTSGFRNFDTSERGLGLGLTSPESKPKSKPKSFTAFPSSLTRLPTRSRSTSTRSRSFRRDRDRERELDHPNTSSVHPQLSSLSPLADHNYSTMSTIIEPPKKLPFSSSNDGCSSSVTETETETLATFSDGPEVKTAVSPGVGVVMMQVPTLGYGTNTTTTTTANGHGMEEEEEKDTLAPLATTTAPSNLAFPSPLSSNNNENGDEASETPETETGTPPVSRPLQRAPSESRFIERLSLNSTKLDVLMALASIEHARNIQNNLNRSSSDQQVDEAGSGSGPRSSTGSGSGSGSRATSTRGDSHDGQTETGIETETEMMESQTLAQAQIRSEEGR